MAASTSSASSDGRPSATTSSVAGLITSCARCQAHSRSKPRTRSQSVTARSNASSSTRAMFDVVVDHVVAEGLAGHLAGRAQARPPRRRVVGTRGCVGLVGVADVLGAPASSPCSMPCRPAATIAGDGQVGVDVAAGHAALDPQRRAVADDAKGAGAVVAAPGERGRGEGAWHEALVAVDVRRREEVSSRERGQLAGDEVLDRGREPVRARRRPSPASSGSREARGGCGRSCPPAASHLAMKVRLMPSWRGDLLGPGLVDGVVVAALSRGVGVPEGDLVLAQVALALGRLDVHARRRSSRCGSAAAAARPGRCRGSSSRRCTGWPGSGRGSRLATPPRRCPRRR